MKKCTFKINDGSTLSLTIKIGEGNLTYSEKVAREYIKNRGVLDTVRNGDETPMEVSFEFTWEFLKSPASSTTPPTVEEALKKTGAASAWVSAATDVCEPYAVDIEVTFDPACTGVKKEVYLFPDFRHESLDHDFRAGTVSCKGMCNAVEPTITRVT